jgi:hypothetical protein
MVQKLVRSMSIKLIKLMKQNLMTLMTYDSMKNSLELVHI